MPSWMLCRFSPCRPPTLEASWFAAMRVRTEGEQPQGVVDPILILVRQDLGPEPDGKVLDGNALHFEASGVQGRKEGDRGKVDFSKTSSGNSGDPDQEKNHVLEERQPGIEPRGSGPLHERQ